MPHNWIHTATGTFCQDCGYVYSFNATTPACTGPKATPSPASPQPAPTPPIRVSGLTYPYVVSGGKTPSAPPGPAPAPAPAKTRRYIHAPMPSNGTGWGGKLDIGPTLRQSAMPYSKIAAIRPKWMKLEKNAFVDPLYGHYHRSPISLSPNCEICAEPTVGSTPAHWNGMDFDMPDYKSNNPCAGTYNVALYGHFFPVEPSGYFGVCKGCGVSVDKVDSDVQSGNSAACKSPTKDPSAVVCEHETAQNVAAVAATFNAATLNAAFQWGTQIAPAPATGNNITQTIANEVRLRLSPPARVRCECGSASIGIANYHHGHSDWCPVSINNRPWVEE